MFYKMCQFLKILWFTFAWGTQYLDGCCTDKVSATQSFQWFKC